VVNGGPTRWFCQRFPWVVNLDVPEVPLGERVEVQTLDAGFARVRVRYGFMQRPDVPAALALCAEHGLRIADRALVPCSRITFKPALCCRPGRSSS
jgi:K+ transporter